MIFKDNKILLGTRKGSHGDGELAFPGGHHEHLESIEACARRETKEECGLEIQNVRFLCLANITEYAPKHYINITLIADWLAGEPQVLEPEKCHGWDWYDVNELPPLPKIVARCIEAYKTGRNYFDSD